MAPVKFAIPLQRKDLLRSSSDNAYMVENEYSIRELKTKLVVSKNGLIFLNWFQTKILCRMCKFWWIKKDVNSCWKVASTSFSPFWIWPIKIYLKNTKVQLLKLWPPGWMIWFDTLMYFLVEVSLFLTFQPTQVMALFTRCTMWTGFGNGYLILSSLNVNFHTHAKVAFRFDMPLHIT